MSKIEFECILERPFECFECDFYEGKSGNRICTYPSEWCLYWDSFINGWYDEMVESELDKLEKYLQEKDFHYQRTDEYISDRNIFDIHQIVVFKNYKRWFDVICQGGSYGYEKGLLEYYNEDDDDVKGWLTSKDVIRIIESI